MVAEALKEGGEGGAENALESYGFSPEEIEQVVAKMEELGAAEQLTNKEAFTLMTGIEGLSNEFASLPSPDELGALATSADSIDGSSMDSLASSLSTAETNASGLVGQLKKAADYDGTSIDIAVNYTSTGSAPTKGQWETGLGYVPYNNYLTTLDEGEMVLTKAQAERYRRGEKDGAVGSALILPQHRSAQKSRVRWQDSELTSTENVRRV